MAVTRNMSASTPGFLPVHCVHQLLVNRVFTKHKVQIKVGFLNLSIFIIYVALILIKDWILEQLKNCTVPLHPMIPALLDSFATSCIIPVNKSPHVPFHTEVNTAFSEQEIMVAHTSKLHNMYIQYGD